jgi:hypothetical protein
MSEDNNPLLTKIRKQLMDLSPIWKHTGYEKIFNVNKNTCEMA